MIHDKYQGKTKTRARALFLLLVATAFPQPLLAQTSLASLPQFSADEKAWLDSHPSITVATFDPGWLPFEHLDESGQLEGLAPDYLKIISEALGRPIVPVRFESWPEAFSAACSGKVDILMNVAITPERTGCVVFTKPYVDTANVVISKSTRATPDSRTLESSSIAVESGFAASKAISERYPLARQVIVPTTEQALTALKSGAADFYVGNPFVVAPLLEDAGFGELAILRNADLPVSSLHFAINDEEKPLASAMDRVLSTIPESRHQAIRSQWLGSSAGEQYRDVRVALSAKERQWLHHLPRLRIGFNAAWDAISPENDGRLSGVAGEYSQLLQDRLGLGFVPVPTESRAALSTLIKQGQIDIAVMTVGSENSDRFVYTDPIAKLANVIVARNDRTSIGSGADLNRKVVATIGKRREEFILRQSPQANVVLVEDITSGIGLVDNGSADAYVGDVVSVNRSIRSGNDHLRIVAPAGFDDQVAFAVERTNQQLVSLINRVLAGMTDEERQRIRAGWLQVDVHYGVQWRSVLIGVLLSATTIGLLAFFYLRTKREISRREVADALISAVTGNLPSVVFKISAKQKRLTAAYIGGNTESLFGVSAEDAKSNVELLLGKFSPADRARIRNILGAPGEGSVDVDVRTEERWIRMSAAPRRLPNGVTNWSGYFADVTQEHAQLDALATAKTAAELAANAKSTFLATMSHEIRTPLSGLVGIIDLIGRTELSSDQHKMLQLAGDSAQSLKSLLDDILDFSKIESGRLELTQGNLRVRDVICDSILLMSGAAEKKGLTIGCKIAPGIAGVLAGDEGRVRQILLNLLSNAIKFTDSGSVLINAYEIDGKPGLQCLSIDIVDTGMGISEAEIGSIFEPFTQAKASSSNPSGGTGLGLAIAQRLARIMGGDVSLHSAPGHGTTARLHLCCNVLRADCDDRALAGKQVMIRHADARIKESAEAAVSALGMCVVDNAVEAHLILADVQAGGLVGHPFVLLSQLPPLAAMSIQSTAVSCSPLLITSLRDACLTALAGGGDSALSTPAVTSGPTQQQPAILVCEDDATNRFLICSQLTALGYSSEVVADGEAALDAWKSGRFGVVITDIQMPKVSGLELAQAIREAERAQDLPATPLIALTAGAFQEDINRCAAAGLDDHLAKPASLAALSKCLSKWAPSPQSQNPQAPAREALIRERGNDLIAQASRAFLADADHVQAELAAAMRRSDQADIHRILHRLSGALPVLGQKPLAKRIRQLLLAMDEEGLSRNTPALNQIQIDVRDYVCGLQSKAESDPGPFGDPSASTLATPQLDRLSMQSSPGDKLEEAGKAS